MSEDAVAGGWYDCCSEWSAWDRTGYCGWWPQPDVIPPPPGLEKEAIGFGDDEISPRWFYSGAAREQTEDTYGLRQALFCAQFPTRKQLTNATQLMQELRDLLHMNRGDFSTWSRNPKELVASEEQTHQENTSSHVNFKTKLCTHHMKGSCKRGESCNFAHGQEELVLTEVPLNAKTKLCDYFNKGSCLRGDCCTFAHGPNDLAAVAREPADQDTLAEAQSHQSRLEELTKKLLDTLELPVEEDSLLELLASNELIHFLNEALEKLQGLLLSTTPENIRLDKSKRYLDVMKVAYEEKNLRLTISLTFNLKGRDVNRCAIKNILEFDCSRGHEISTFLEEHGLPLNGHPQLDDSKPWIHIPISIQRLPFGEQHFLDIETKLRELLKGLFSTVLKQSDRIQLKDITVKMKSSSTPNAFPMGLVRAE